MPARTIAIGDIHGCHRAFSALLDQIGPTRDDTIVLLGDLIDRGPQSRAVVEEAIKLSQRCFLVMILGNHEELMLNALEDSAQIPRWLRNGGVETLQSYGWVAGGPRRALSDWFPAAHIDFISSGQSYLETSEYIFVHAGYVTDVPMAEQPALALRWRVCGRDSEPHCSGKTVLCGHTAQKSGEILDLGHLKCIDTDCWRGGWLTAWDGTSDSVWQVNRDGQRRETR